MSLSCQYMSFKNKDCSERKSVFMLEDSSPKLQSKTKKTSKFLLAASRHAADLGDFFEISVSKISAS